MNKEILGPENAIWDDGEWVSWHGINTHLERLELQARYPRADVELIAVFEELLAIARHYHLLTGRHLQVYGDIGELWGAITCGIALHQNYAKGSDGRLGDDFVEIKTITPFKGTAKVTVNMERHFSKLLVVRIDEDFEVAGRMVDRKSLPKTGTGRLTLTWEALGEM